MGSLVKSLELQGYKTFASSTEFSFADTVTAIVGPNGSGKSNIVDALRWVLGEQSYSLLRGKKTEDMIFAGSEQRARAGMASATLTFSNESGWLPIDFSEVAITRRAYRDGQNEYVLNGQRVRLKDVSELLSKSGLAERTYTIIGQGLVDAALSLKAEERRKLFEEAAGIGLYRTRREEAFRRLDTTQRNIERVQDILTELRPHLRSLERQAEKAREYERMKTDLRLLLREWYGYHWHRAQGELLHARGFSLEQEMSLENTRREQEQIDVQLSDVRRDISENREKISLWRRKSIDLQSERERLRREIAVADERIRSIQEQYENVNLEILRADTELEQREILLKKAIDYLDRQKGELTDAQSQATIVIEELQSGQALRLESEKELIDVRSNLSELQARKSYLEATLASYTGQVEGKQNELSTIGLSLSEYQNDYNQNKKNLDQYVNDLENVTKSKDRIEGKIRHLAVKRNSIEDAVNKLVKQQNVLVIENDRLLSQLDLIEKGDSSFSYGAIKLLENAELMNLGDRLGVMREFLEIPDQYKVAIAAALGEYLDSVVVEDDRNIGEILDLLGVEGVRGSLIPLNRLKPHVMKIAQVDRKGVIGIASELVTFSPQIGPAVKLLLGKVLIVENRQSAMDLVADLAREIDSIDLKNGDLRIATINGEVFFLSGPILGGRDSRHEKTGDDQQRSEFQSKLQKNEKNLDQIEELLNKEQAELDKIVVEDSQLRRDLSEIVKDEEQKRKNRDRTAFELERSRTHHEVLKEQSVALEVTIQDDGKQMPVIEEEIRYLDSLISSQRDIIRKKEVEVDKNHPLIELQDNVTHWKTTLAVLERGIEDTKRQIEDRHAIFERARADFVALKQRVKELDSSKTIVQEKKEQLVDSEIKVAEDMANLSELITPAEHELAEQEHQQQELIISDGQARQSLNMAEHQYAQARITHAQKQESLETLKHRIEDDFGLVAFEYTDGISGPRPLPIDGMVEQLPIIEEVPEDIEDDLRIQRAALRRLGAINPEAQVEFHEIKDRFEFLTDQIGDLQQAELDIRQVINELDELMRREFLVTFTAVADEFGNIFTRLFGGGSARLILTNPDDLTETGIDIEARLPGRREQGLSLLSGGERSLAATSLVFALLKVSPTPFCVLDEVDAMLDESNTGRFRDLLNELSQNTQFVVITHNRNTVQVADVIYGITMGRDSSSQVISLKMDEVMEAVR